MHILIRDFTTESEAHYSEIPLSYQTFGRPLGTAPVVLVNHALTGNSNVAGETGWWKDVIGENQAIDLKHYTVLAFNIPGNGFDSYEIENYKDFIARDIARIFLQGIKQLGIEQLYAIIGGSLGGGIAWEMAVLQPKITKHLIVIASDWKSTDWLIANCQVQEQILLNSIHPVHDARMHAMLCYRTPESFKSRFQRTKDENQDIFNVESWLLHHGKKLQERFQLSAYRLMNQLLKTIDATNGSDSQEILQNIEAEIHIIGVDSDLFFTAEENRETHKQLAASHANVTYHEIHSAHGHDAFLIEYQQLKRMIAPIFNDSLKKKKVKVVKFGGKSLSNESITNVVAIIQQKIRKKEQLAVVVSARGNATDTLEDLLESAAKGKEYQEQFTAFKEYQSKVTPFVDYSTEYHRIQELLEGVALLGDYSSKIKDELLAQGELISSKTLAALLQKENIDAIAVDTRQLLVTDSNFGNALPNDELSKTMTIDFFKELNGKVPIVTGFIAANENGETTTLGRNGSNYSAALLANYLNAEEVQNFTHVNGIFTANPDLVPDAKKIEELTFSEANELANLGATILHAKTIVPLLEKNINLRILNTNNPDDQGTLITAKTKSKGIRSLTVAENVVLINFEGRGLLGQVGVDARVFGTLSNRGISVSIISQGSSERGLGFVVEKERAEEAIAALTKEFETDFYTKDVSNISVIDQVAVVSIVGQDLSEFQHAYNALISNHIRPILFNNTVSGKNVSLVLKKQDLHKALNVIHGQVFGIARKINLAILGKGQVGSALINQILTSRKSLLEKRKLQLNIFAIANSKGVLFHRNGIADDWQEQLETELIPNAGIAEVIDFAEQHHLENLIAVDNTASAEVVEQYVSLIEAGFDIVSSNKIANTISYDFYKELRENLEHNKKTYLYETNVGAGLPLIDTIQLLHASGENITRIRGVFSGSLSYIFNTFSEQDVPFSQVIQEAIQKGYTEPDARDDLGGKDVARKLLILARELDLENELADVNIHNLIPEQLSQIPLSEFMSRLEELDSTYQSLKDNLADGEVLRYLGDLHGDLFQNKGILDVNLVAVPKHSPIGGLRGSDAIFEIYTESYGEQPIVIQGAGAGAEVTARGVFGDILRQINNKA